MDTYKRKYKCISKSLNKLRINKYKIIEDKNLLNGKKFKKKMINLSTEL